MRQAKITRILEDGTEDVTYIDLPDNKTKVKNNNKRSSKEKVTNEDNKKQEEEQASPTSKATISIKRTES